MREKTIEFVFAVSISNLGRGQFRLTVIGVMTLDVAATVMAVELAVMCTNVVNS